MFASYAIQEHWPRIMTELQLDQAAYAFLDQKWKDLRAAPESFEALDALAPYVIREPQTRLDEGLAKAGQIASAMGCHAFTYHFFLLAHTAYWLRKQYDDRGIAEEIFWDTIRDLRCKLYECHQNHGVWGVAAGWWYKRIFSCDIFALGRLQFERAIFPFREPYCQKGLCVALGDPVLSIHVPSSGPLARELRQDAYRRAFAFFSHDGRPIICTCDSWLLFPAHEQMLPVDSNIRSFIGDFDIIHVRTDDGPRGPWQVFGSKREGPPQGWPERTSLQRAYKRHVLAGGATGGGFGIMAFDGERIL